MCGRGDGSFRPRMRGGRDGDRNGGRGGNKIPYQVCGKTGHGALWCYKRFDASNNGEEKHAHAATTDYNVDTEWYTDIGATDHITSELDKLIMKEKIWWIGLGAHGQRIRYAHKPYWSIYNSYP
jgi:hypothetical protein